MSHRFFVSWSRFSKSKEFNNRKASSIHSPKFWAMLFKTPLLNILILLIFAIFVIGDSHVIATSTSLPGPSFSNSYKPWNSKPQYLTTIFYFFFTLSFRFDFFDFYFCNAFIFNLIKLIIGIVWIEIHFVGRGRKSAYDDRRRKYSYRSFTDL